MISAYCLCLMMRVKLSCIATQCAHEDLVSFYVTRGDPFNQLESRYGSTYKPEKYFAHLLPRYQGKEFTTPVILEKVIGCRDLYAGRKLINTIEKVESLHVTGLNRSPHLADAVSVI